MSSEIGQVPFPYPRSRPRAVTDKIQAVNSPQILTCRSPDVGSQAGGVGDHVHMRAASGSLRHPKPLSPSDIHSILEQEQEAMVNRLSRELSVLRRRTASVASTNSSTSTTLNDSLDALHGSPHIAGPIYPTASRRHRSSSSLSASYFPVIQSSRINGRSRRPSVVSPQQSQSLTCVASQPQERKQDSSAQDTHSSRLYSHRSPASQQRTLSGSSTFRPEETISIREELEALKDENDVLRRRIRDLELQLQKN
ncbi:uncharacterized protein BJX67DRAFT_6698 [Aspergillus lucknowensis]|uniref:Uncharacterized protein n=1 Tax=Aspergillus lucknowensis TaxID=176173 RepID=A0ABR4M7A6_9EURO